jgi:hypothetical protein
MDGALANNSCFSVIWLSNADDAPFMTSAASSNSHLWPAPDQDKVNTPRLIELHDEFDKVSRRIQVLTKSVARPV